MNNGKLAETNHAIVTLRYVEETEKALAPASFIVIPARDKGVVSYQWALIGLALLAALVTLLAARKRWQKSKGHDQHVHMVDDYSNQSTTYDFSDFVESPNSNESKIQPTQRYSRRSVGSNSKDEHLYPFEIEGIDDFIVNRFSLDDLSSNAFTETGDNISFSPTFLPNNALVHDHIGTVKLRSHSSRSEGEFTYEGKGTNRGMTPKCSICFKNADGWMKRCHCGNSSCDKIAHATCVNGKYPTPSISYPGTPPPMLPPILCGSESSWVRRSRSCDEDSSIEAGMSISQSSDKTVRAYDQLHLGCLPCR